MSAQSSQKAIFRAEKLLGPVNTYETDGVTHVQVLLQKYWQAQI